MGKYRGGAHTRDAHTRLRLHSKSQGGFRVGPKISCGEIETDTPAARTEQRGRRAVSRTLRTASEGDKSPAVRHVRTASCSPNAVRMSLTWKFVSHRPGDVSEITSSLCAPGTHWYTSLLNTWCCSSICEKAAKETGSTDSTSGRRQWCSSTRPPRDVRVAQTHLRIL